jgi:hypothetical protein
MSSLYDSVKVRRVEGGWIVSYWNHGDTDRIFTKWDELVTFIKTRLK